MVGIVIVRTPSSAWDWQCRHTHGWVDELVEVLGGAGLMAGIARTPSSAWDW